MMSVTALLLALLVLQSAPVGQAPAPPGTNTLSPGGRPPAEATPVEKKRLGPPAGTPGRAALFFVHAEAQSGTPSGASDRRAVTAQITAELLSRGAAVIDQGRAELMLVENGLPAATVATLHENPRAMKLLNLDAVILARVTRTTALVSLATAVELTLVDSDGRPQEVSRAISRSVPSGAISGAVGTSGAAGPDEPLGAMTLQSLARLLQDYEIVTAPSR